MGLSRYLVREASKFYFGKRTVWTYPALHLGLFTTLPTGPDDAGTELSAAGYARQLTDEGADWFLGRDAGLLRPRNLRSFYFGPAGAPWSVTGFGLWDASTAGNLLVYGGLTAPVTVPAGRGLRMPPQGAWIGGVDWKTGGSAVLSYIMPANYGLPAWYQPPHWRLFPLVVEPTYADYNADFPRNFPPDGALSVLTVNDATAWPLVGADVTNGAALAFPAASVDWPDVTALLVRGDFGGYWSYYWTARLTATATVRQGERLEIAAGAVQFGEL